MGKVKIEGLTAFAKVLSVKKEYKNDVQNIVKKHGAGLSDKTQTNMLNQYKGHYEGKKFVKPTGATRRSAKVQISNGGMTATVAPSTKYFPYVEYGTRFMRARPTLGPAFRAEAPLFKKDIEKFLKK